MNTPLPYIGATQLIANLRGRIIRLIRPYLIYAHPFFTGNDSFKLLLLFNIWFMSKASSSNIRLKEEKEAMKANRPLVSSSSNMYIFGYISAVAFKYTYPAVVFLQLFHSKRLEISVFLCGG